ncbi:MAG: YheT family hydrolase [Flammeovirgaceae bacterium]
MPLINQSSYSHPFYLFNGHIQTIVPSIFRTVEGVTYTRQRLELPDGDFLDIDWLNNDAQRLVIISHGLEGSSHRHYVKGMANYFFDRGWSALAWNCRGCSGEMNRLPKFYHHGATEDLKAVVDHAIEKGYNQIALVGISMGGSMTLKYFGEHGAQLPYPVKCAAVFSVPCHLGDSARELDKPHQKFYLNRFLKKLSKKIEKKSILFPNIISHTGFKHIQSFREFDNRYTAPLHGFQNADDFYERASSGPYIEKIQRPVLIVNALNDPFLPVTCFPFQVARTHPLVWLETPRAGGHVGFSLKGKKENWMELRAFEFTQQYIP